MVASPFRFGETQVIKHGPLAAPSRVFAFRKDLADFIWCFLSSESRPP